MGITASTKGLYSLHEPRSVRLRVRYPEHLDRIVLRTELDWDKDIMPSAVDPAECFAEFNFEISSPFLYLKPCLRHGQDVRWPTGPNRLLVATRDEVHEVYPNFHSAAEGKILDVIAWDSKILNRQHSLRVYLPPGYEENTCRSFP